MLPRVSAAIAQLVKPIASGNGQAVLSKHFERFAAGKQADSDHPKNQNQENQQEQQQSPAPINVIPIRPDKAGENKSLAQKSDFVSRLSHLGSDSPFFSFIHSLTNSHKTLLGIGRILYAKMRKEQDKSRLRKGAIIDHKA